MMFRLALLKVTGTKFVFNFCAILAPHQISSPDFYLLNVGMSDINIYDIEQIQNILLTLSNEVCTK